MSDVPETRPLLKPAGDRPPPASPHDPRRPDAQPRLGVAHLMAWAVASAVYVAIQRVVLPQDLWQSFSSAQLALMAFESLSGGATLAALLLFVARRSRGAPFPRQPGEWLWCLLGLVLVLMLFFGVVLAPLGLGHVTWRLQYPTSWVAFSAVAVFARQPDRWRVFMATVAAINALQGLFSFTWPTLFLNSTGNPTLDLIRQLTTWLIEPIVALPLLVGVVWLDLQHEGRPWTHWVGVVLYAYGWLLRIAWRVADVLIWYGYF